MNSTDASVKLTFSFLMCVILDVRAEGHWGQSSHKIPGSERVDYRNVAQWANNYASEKPIVLYCA